MQARSVIQGDFFAAGHSAAESRDYLQTPQFFTAADDPMLRDVNTAFLSVPFQF